MQAIRPLSFLAVGALLFPTAAAAQPTASQSLACQTDGQVEDLAVRDGVVYLVGQFTHVRPPGEIVGGVEVSGGAACGGDGLVGFQQRDLFALALADGAMLDWNPDTGGIPGTWAVVRGEGRLHVGGTLVWPRTGPATHANLLAFDLPLFSDDFESGSTDRWTPSL